MDDNNGNGKVTNAVQNTKIDQLVKDVGEIKNDLRKFIDGTVDVRMHCSNEFGSVRTHIRVIWGFVSAIMTGAALAILKLMIGGRI